MHNIASRQSAGRRLEVTWAGSLVATAILATSVGAEVPTKSAIEQPNGLIHLVAAPEEAFHGRIFLINDWDGGDADNQNAGEELNRNSPIKQGITILSDLPEHEPKKVAVEDLVTDAHLLARASKEGKVALAMGAHSRHALAWLTALPPTEYDYTNIVLVTHSNWNEVDGRAGYDANKLVDDPPLQDTHGDDLRRGLYNSLARISDLGVAIWEIPRTDSRAGGWGGRVDKIDGGTAVVKSLDISDLGLVHYLKTGVLAAKRSDRNQFVSDALKKPDCLAKLNREIITRYWDSNRGIPGKKEDYLPGGKFYQHPK